VPSPLPTKALMVLLLAFATTKSLIPSPLKSPIASAAGKLPAEMRSSDWNMPQAAYHRDVNESAALPPFWGWSAGGVGLILLTYALVLTAIGLGNGFA
jgi:hypothetical protein